MTSRREFLLKSGLGALGLLSPFASNAVKGNSEIDALDIQSLNWKKIRKAFPLDKKLCYLNNGTLGPSPQSVLDSIEEETRKVNRLMHSPQKNKSAKEGLATLLGVDSKSIALTHNVTEGINIAAWCVDLRKGDEVIMTNQEHVGNALPWLNRKRLDGITIRSFEPGNTAEKVLNQVADLITPKTRVIAIPHIPCTTGQVYPIKEICDLAKSKNIITIVDGAHGPGMLQIRPKEIGCDIYVSCCHKWLLGPKGTGFVYFNPSKIPAFDPRFVGAHTDTGWTLDPESQELKGFHTHAHKFHFGTQNYANFHGIKACTDFHLALGAKNIESRIKELNNYAYAQLESLEGFVEILTPKEQKSRAGIVTFKMKDVSSKKFVKKLRDQRFVLRYLPESGHDAIRVSTHIYNSKEEIDQLMDYVEKEKK